MKGWLLFAGGSLITVVVVGLVSQQVFSTPEDRRAIWISVAVAYLLQMVTFWMARRWRGKNLMAGWGAGLVMRLAALMVLGVAVGPMHLPPLAALLTLATCLFASTLIEALLLQV